MATPFNPDLMTKDELLYEALIRSLPHENVTVAELRKNLRESFSVDTPIQVERLKYLEYDVERQFCYSKYCEMLVRVQQMKQETNPAEILRTTYRVEHLMRRIKNLLIWPGVLTIPLDVQKFTDEALQELPGVIRNLRRQSDTLLPEEMEASIANATASNPSSPKSEININLVSNPQIESNVAISPLRLTTVDFGLPKYANTIVTSAPSALFQPRSNLDNVNADTNVSSALPQFISSFDSLPYRNEIPLKSNIQFKDEIFSKISNPVEKILSQMRQTDGLNIPELIEFMKYMLDIQEMQQLSEHQILQILMIKAKNPLKDKIQQTLNLKKSIDDLHAQIIQHFIPTRIYDDLKRKMVLRVQNYEEKLAHYISDIRETSKVLRTNMTESQIVETILIGLSPAERSRLVMSNRPASFIDLERACIHTSNVWYSDMSRSGHTPHPSNITPQRSMSRYQGQPNYRPRYQLNSNNQNPTRNESNNSNYQYRNVSLIKCSHCGKPGHTVQYCYKRKNNYSNNSKNV